MGDLTEEAKQVIRATLALLEEERVLVQKEDQKQIIRNALVLLADERIRVRAIIEANIVHSIKLEEVERRLANAYRELRGLLHQNDPIDSHKS